MTEQNELVAGALEEMAYETGSGSFGQNMASSTPAQLQFTTQPTQATRRFHVELRRRGYSALDSEPAKRHRDDADIDGVYYDGEIASREHWDRMRVLIFRDQLVRLYLLDGWDITEEELMDIINAIETGFGAPLEHHPIEKGKER